MFSQFKQRSYALERIDTGDFTAAEYTLWKREIRAIHRVFGERRAVRNSLLRAIAATDGPVSILDAGAGSGEMLRNISRRLGGREITLTGAELGAEGTRAMQEVGFRAVQCDATRLPFADGSFDYAFCSLVLHHLDNATAAKMLSEMARVARRRIFAVDLRRSPVAYHFYHIVGRLVLQPFTHHDGSLSVLRSFVPAELRAIAEMAGLAGVSVKRSAAYRLVLSANGNNG